MSTVIGTSSGLDSALRRAFSDASVRPQPTTTMTSVIEALGAMGVTAEVQDGVLVLRQDQTTFNTSLALRSFAAKPEHQKLFVIASTDPKTWTLAEKAVYLKTHTPEEYAKLCRAPVLES